MSEPLTETELRELTARHLSRWPGVARLEPILKGGSDRRFFRLHFDDAHVRSLILMTYTLARPDNPRFVSATHRLDRLGVRVPRIFAHDDEKLCIWLEDLGASDLYAYREAPWLQRRPLYEAALREVAKLHAVNAGALTADNLAEMELCFDERLYEWEQQYFLTHYVRDLRKRDVSGSAFQAAHDALQVLRDYLASLPRGLVHRDFQSQNVIIREGDAWLIDYQGVRPGLAEYDLASLLLDPYVNLTDAERDELLHWYAHHTSRDLDAIRETYFLCAAQRLMQAIGAYANLSRKLGKTSFEQHIPVALQRLRTVCEAHPMLAPLRVLVADS
jgi:aminoglycoside/choline kinase family phosphotransferase